MAKPRHAPSVAPYSIRDLLAEATNRLLASSAGNTDVYTFPAIDGLDDYVLRIEKPESFAERLQHTTALVPVPRLVTGRHIGQPLMQFAGEDGARVSILLRQKGHSLAQHYRDYLPTTTPAGDSDRQQAWTNMLEDILATRKGKNPFTPLLAQAYDLGWSGFAPDFAPANVFFNPETGTLHLVDQLEHRLPVRGADAAEDAQTALALATERLRILSSEYGYAETGPLGDRYKAATGHIETLIDEAAEAVRARHAQDTIADYRRQGIAFANVDDVQAVSLDAPPHLLVEQLHRLHDHANLPLRR